MSSFKRNLTSFQNLEYGTFQFLEHFIGHKATSSLFGKSQKKFEQRVTTHIMQNSEGRAIPVERRDNLSLEEFRNYYQKKRIPVIFKGVAKDWECTKKWSFQYFKELHGTDEVVMNTPEEGKDVEIALLADVIDSILAGKKKYYRFYPLLKRHPEHIKDFDYKWLRAAKTRCSLIEAFRVFVGARDTITMLHDENICNLFLQVVGEKQWVLYPPASDFIMRPKAIRNLLRRPSIRDEKGIFDPFKPNYNAPFGLYKFTDRYECIIGPGDILWSPPFYWHTVKNVTDSIGVGYRWFDPMYAFKVNPLYMFLDLFSVNPTIFKFFRLYKEDANLIFLAQKGKLNEYMAEMRKRKSGISAE